MAEGGAEAGGPVDLSIVVPVYDEAENIRCLADEIEAALGAADVRWECVWVDDGSRDGSLMEIKALVARGTAPHRYVALSSNQGQSAALWAGFLRCRGRWIATLDGDGQNDPSDLPRMLEMIRKGSCEMITGWRRKRNDGWIRRVSSRVANAFRSAVTGAVVRDVGCSTRIFRRTCLEGLPVFRGFHRFFPTLVAARGGRVVEIPVNHRPRLKGTSKYNVGNRLWVGLFDTFGVYWFQRRGVFPDVRESSDGQGFEPRLTEESGPGETIRPPKAAWGGPTT